MRKTNAQPALGSLFTTMTAAVSPAHEFIAREPLYAAVPPLEVRLPGRKIGAWVLARLETWQRRREQRRSLALLDDRMLRDIGLDRLHVAEETAKPFWRP